MLEFKDMENKFLKIYLNKKEIGCLEYTLAADEAQIIDIIIKEKYRQQGYGSKILQEFIRNLNKNYSYIILEVRSSNQPAIKLYQKFGFEQIDLRKKYYKDPDEDALVMKKQLK